MQHCISPVSLFEIVEFTTSTMSENNVINRNRERAKKGLAISILGLGTMFFGSQLVLYMLLPHLLSLEFLFNGAHIILLGQTYAYLKDKKRVSAVKVFASIFVLIIGVGIIALSSLSIDDIIINGSNGTYFNLTSSTDLKEANVLAVEFYFLTVGILITIFSVVLIVFTVLDAKDQRNE